MKGCRTAVAVLGALAALGVTACGGSDAPCAAKPGGAPGTVAAPGDCPVNSVIAVDATGAIADRDLAADVSAAAQRAAEHTITAGGHLRMVVFAGDANAVEVIYDDDVPTLEEQDETRRGRLEGALRRALGSTLDGALGVDGSDRELRARVRELSRGGTSDIARAVRNALRTLSQRDGAKAMTLVSDGAQASDQLTLTRRIAAGDSATALGDDLGELLGSAKGIDVLQVVGLGRLPGRVNQSARRTDELVEIWTDACKQTGAKHCAMTTEL
ncbi:MAG: hypothetical protein QOE31_2592 [Solirubrobacteraceae bacterium]|jgi:hypothetical protein|nr:hypothetical protein [Solirubrobacteraceae bacterium]